MFQVNPVEARKGQFLKSFPVSQYQDMLDFCHETEMAMFRHRITGTVVFTRIGMGTQKRQWDTWQVFILAQSIRDTAEERKDRGTDDIGQ